MTDLSTGGGLTADRINLIPTPLMFPHNCSVCGTPNGPVVSWGLRVERHGAVYMCVNCMKSAALLLGMTPMEKLDEITMSYEDLISELTAERDELLKRVEDQNIGQDLDTRVRNSVTSALTDPDVLAALKDSLFPDRGITEPEPELSANDGPLFRI